MIPTSTRVSAAVDASVIDWGFLSYIFEIEISRVL
jgi:hypothetical protein